MITTKATCIEKNLSASGEVSLVSFRPEEHFDFLAGQFMMIEADCRGNTVKNPYSIATTPTQLLEEKRIGFYVKKTSDKGLSARLTQGIQEGDSITLQGPVGHYTKNNDTTDFLLISTGSGLSPNLGLLQDIVASNQYNTIVSIFGERYHNQTVPEANQILSQYAHYTQSDGSEGLGQSEGLEQYRQSGKKTQPAIHTWNFLSQEKNLPAGRHPGRIQQGIDNALAKFTDLTKIQVFLCGGFGMVKEVSTLLQEKGVPKECITMEKW